MLYTFRLWYITVRVYQLCRWWREGRDSTILSVSSQYTILNVEISSVGRYYCQPQNSLGQVDVRLYL